MTFKPFLVAAVVSVTVSLGSGLMSGAPTVSAAAPAKVEVCKDAGDGSWPESGEVVRLTQRVADKLIASGEAVGVDYYDYDEDGKTCTPK